MRNSYMLPYIRVRDTGPGTPFVRKAAKPPKAERPSPPKKFPDEVVAAVKYESRFKSTQQLVRRFGICYNNISVWLGGASRFNVQPAPATPEVEQWIQARKEAA